MIRVFIADDHPLFREGLTRILSEEKDVCVVGTAADGDEVLARLDAESWQILILDLSMPGRSGLDVVTRVKVARPQMKILILTMHAEDQYALRLMRAGADGYVTKGSPTSRVLEALRTIASGERYVPPRLAQLLLDDPSAGTRAPHEQLTHRELEVLVMIGRGMTPSAIGHALDLGQSTVSTHLRRIRDKLSVDSIGEIAQYALRVGLVS